MAEEPRAFALAMEVLKVDPAAVPPGMLSVYMQARLVVAVERVAEALMATKGF